MSEHRYEIIDALVDGERLDPEALERALAEAGGRDYLIDVLALRDALAQTTPAVQPAITARIVRPTWQRAIAWPAAAAVLVGSLAAGFAAGYRFAGAASQSGAAMQAQSPAIEPTAQAPGPSAPAPTRVIRLESGVDWQEGTGGD